MIRGVVRFIIILLFAAQIHAASVQIRVVTFNASLNRTTQDGLPADLSTTTNVQAQKVAEILQRVRPDVVLLNEIGRAHV